MTPIPDEGELMTGTVFAQAAEPAYVMDPESDRILDANDAGCAMLGYTRAELLDTPISRIHPSELPELSELLERVLRHGRASTITLTCRTKSGTFLPTEISVHALEIGGRTRILGLVHDRSEHRQPGLVSAAEDGHSSGTGRPGTLGGSNRALPNGGTEMSTTTPPTVTQRGRVRVEHGTKRVRAYLGGALVADTTSPLLVWEKPFYPAYYFPAADVRTELLTPDGVTHSPSRGDGRTFTVRAGGKEAAGAALRYEQSPFDELRDAIRLQWDSMDAWYEEDEQVFTHPRDPYTRVDILPSSRHVRIEVDGVTIAETEKPTLLFETGLRTRYYVPMTHVRMDLLTRSESVSHCPYKGAAEYWSLQAGDDIRPDVAWSYRTPLPESQKIAGLISFYPEKVEVYVDGELER